MLFVRQAYFNGAGDPYEKLKRTVWAEIDGAGRTALHSSVRRPLERPKSGRIAVRVRENRTMLRVIEPVEIEFTTCTAVEDARQRVLSTIYRIGGRVKVDSARDIVAGFGSGWKARLLGVLLGGINCFPRDVVVVLRTNNERTQVKVSVRDTFGFGSRAGIGDRIQKLMYDNALAVKSAFPDAQ